MTDEPDVHARPALPGPGEVDVPDTDDPAVLRELLRQAREHLHLRASIERLMADNVARMEALLLEARATQAGPVADPVLLRSEIAAARTALADALAALDRLAALAGRDAPAASAPTSPAAVPSVAKPSDTPPGAVDVLIHEVHSPALARSLQQYLSGLDGVSRAEVRELAEGLLRITVESATPLDGDALAGWEPQRSRAIRTARPDVLEIELT